MHKALSLIPGNTNPSTPEVEGGRSKVQGHSLLHNLLNAHLESFSGKQKISLPLKGKSDNK